MGVRSLESASTFGLSLKVVHDCKYSMAKEKNEYTDNLRKLKSQLMAATLKEKRDERSYKAVKRSRIRLDWGARDELMIDDEVWEYIVSDQGHDPKEVFCHPDVLMESPLTSLYYRGLAGLSIKAARDYVGAIENLENGSTKAKLSRAKALTMARTYNTFISSIIRNTKNWKLEDGSRMVLATLGITFDGVMRNKIGEIAEERIRVLLVEWLESNELIAFATPRSMIHEKTLQKEYQLRGGVIMQFASEPDVAFLKNGELLAVVEIKGGIDPAGALERYGAAIKSFEDSIKKSPRCKTFYVGGVFTDELTRRINADRLVEKSFSVIEILQQPAAREDFLRELFHHTLRVV